jgi:type VI secretion system protein ImpF
MADPQVRSRLNPTLFDKLVADNDIAGLRGDELEKVEESRKSLGYFTVTQIERFNENSLRATVRRELAWLFNTTNLASIVDLEPFPEVQTSVLNYGVPDLSGKSLVHRLVQQRARELRTAIRRFEPRIDEETLRVEPVGKVEKENAITFLIQCDVRNAVRALPVKFRTDIEADTSAVTVRE